MAVASELAPVVMAQDSGAASRVEEAAAEMVRGWLGERQCVAHGACRLVPIGARKSVDDSPARFAAVQEDGQRVAIVFVSSRVSAGLMARGAERARAAAEMLGPELGAAVLQPLGSGWVEGLSIAAYPWRREIGGGFVWSRLQRPRIRAWVMEWLRGVAGVCARREHRAEDAGVVRRRLDGLLACEPLGAEMHGLVRTAVRGLEDGAWRPRLVLDHNDLWPGNLMLNRDDRGAATGAGPHVIIDWAGANVEGGGFVDLLRAARGFGLSTRSLRGELAAHCEVLGLRAMDVVPQVLVSLGWLLQNLEHFPMERFVELASRMVKQVREAQGAHA